MSQELNPRGVQTRNLEQYRKLHATRKRAYGTTSNQYYNRLRKQIKSLNPSSLLDYGCGSSNLADKIGKELKIATFKFDPAIPGLDEIPKEALSGVDLVTCIHVLEHLDEREVLEVLRQLKILAPHALIEVPTTPAKTILPNGENAHSTVRTPGWWLSTIRLSFPHVRAVKSSHPNDCTFATWKSNQRVPRGNSRLLAGSVIPENPFSSLDEKSVAVVGRARSLLGAGEGELIDSHDIVIRVNEKLPLDPSLAGDIGERTDLVFTCKGCKAARNYAAQHGVPAEPYDQKLRDHLSDPDGYTPFTGTVAIFEAFRRGAKRVYATGMDLYAGPPIGKLGGHLRLRENQSYSFHDPNRDRELLKELYEDSEHDFVPGKALRECLEQEAPLKHFRGLSPDVVPQTAGTSQSR